MDRLEEARMDFNFQEYGTGERLGNEGFDQLVVRAEAVCECERQRIELANQPAILAKRAEYAALLEKDQELKVRLYRAGPPREGRARRRRIALNWSVAVVLIVAGFVLSLFTLEPFQMGLKGLFYCLGIAVAVPFLVDVMLNRLASERLVRVLVTVASILAVMSLMTLAVIRGELLARHTQHDSDSVVIEGEEPQNEQTKTSFYDDTVPLLQIVMVLLAFAMEVGAGIAMHEAERVSANLGESHADLQREQAALQVRLAKLVQEIAGLQTEAGMFVTTFWRDFHWAVLKRSVSNARRALAIGAAFVFLAAPATRAHQAVELVILIDLSQSVGARGPDGRSEFQQNVAAISRVLRQVPAGAQVTIIAITDDSFGQPYRLLSAAVAREPGYFGEKLSSARQRLDAAWRARSRDLVPSFPGTDLLGALLIAGQIFENAGPGRRDVLVIFSDMWQETGELNFGRVKEWCAPELVERARNQKLLANLRDAHAYALGVDSAGRDKTSWECAHQFWMRYFGEAGAKVRLYSILREGGLSWPL